MVYYDLRVSILASTISRSQLMYDFKSASHI